MIKEILEHLCQKQNLTKTQSHALFDQIIRGELSEVELSALLIALKSKGESSEEIAGAAEALRQAAKPFASPGYEVGDSAGTGGDGLGTVNISTAIAFVLPELGLPMAKHGNVSVSSSCGSADVLKELGVRLDVSPERARKCLDELGVCFLFAPSYHEGMRFAMPVRRALKTRTIFNLLGPLINPSRPAYQIMGVYHPSLCEPIAEALRLLGAKSALVVHGSGLDEIALHGKTTAARVQNGAVESFEMTPEDAGLKSFPLEALAGSSPEQNARWLQKVLAGQGSEAHNAALAINAGALLWVSGRESDLKTAVAKVLDVVRSGVAIKRLRHLVEYTQDD